MTPELFDLTLSTLAAAAERALRNRTACPRCSGRGSVEFVLGSRLCPATQTLALVKRQGVCPACHGQRFVTTQQAQSILNS